VSHAPRDGRTVVPDSAERAFIVDIGAASSRRHAIPAWFDVDVTAVLLRLADRHVTLTTYVVATLARAVARHPRMHALRDPRGRVVIFDSVDVSVSVEVPIDGDLFPMNHVLRGAQARSPDDLQRELHGVKAEPAGSPTMAMADKARLFLVLPPAVRSRLLGMMHRLPDLQSRLVGTVGVTSVGMHSTGGGLGLPFLVHTLDVLVGGMDERPGFDDRGDVVAKRMLSIAVVADHDVIDGAPLARFLADFSHDLQHGGVLG
jgi:pyruvate/2-oxoglutarate dehydrogenase complex dihydrolipoamide acyltransferase (E2) component